MNPLELISMLKNGNPQQVLGNILRNQMGNNPMTNNLFTMLQNNDSNGIEQLARNLSKEKGIDPDKMFNNIRSLFN